MPSVDGQTPARAAEWERPKRYGFLLYDQFPLLPFSGMTDVLRDAAYVTGRDHYEWVTLSTADRDVTAMNGLQVRTDHVIADVPELDVIVVCAGLDGHLIDDPASFAWLKGQRKRGVKIGAIATGCWLLARAGLLRGHTCTLHWEDIPAFKESYPQIAVTQDLFVFDRNIFSCSGGTGAIDMFLNLLAEDLGPEVTNEVARQIMHQTVRSHEDHQPSSDYPYRQITHKSMRLALSKMEENLENPVSISELAKLSHLSQKQLERLFGLYFETTPQLYYRDLRLDRARTLVRLTEMRILEIAVTLGFSNAGYFARCYKQKFGISPSSDRAAQIGFGLGKAAEGRSTH